MEIQKEVQRESDKPWVPSPELLAEAKKVVGLGKHWGDISPEILTQAMIMHATVTDENDREAQVAKYPWVNSPELLAYIKELRDNQGGIVIKLKMECESS